MIIEYMNHRVFYGNTVPFWVKSSGYHRDPDNNTLIGFLDPAHTYYLPDTVKVLSTQELKDRAQDLHLRFPFIDHDTGDDLTVAEVNTMCDDLVTSKDPWGDGVFLEVKTAVSMTTAGQLIILVTDTTAARTITILSDDFVKNRQILIKDISNGAATFNITIATEGSEKIDGVDTVVISTDNGYRRLYCDGSNMFVIAEK